MSNLLATVVRALLRFSCWCPKAIATIKHLPETLADRCIVIGMHRKSLSERCERLRTLKGKEFRRKCARFVMDHANEITVGQPEIPADLNDRAADIWEPLFVLADMAGTDWGQKAREAALGLTAVAQEESPMVTLLWDLWIMFLRAGEALREAEPGAAKKKGGTRMFSRDLVAGLNLHTNRPWVALRRGKEVTELWLSQQLRPYGGKTKNDVDRRAGCQRVLGGRFGGGNPEVCSEIGGQVDV